MVAKAGDREGQITSLRKTGLARAESEVLARPSGRVHEEQMLHEAQQRGTGSAECCEGLRQSVCTEQGARPRTSRIPASREQQGAEEESLEKESQQGDRRGGRWQPPQEPHDRLWAVSAAAEMSTETGIWKCWRGAGK